MVSWSRGAPGPFQGCRRRWLQVRPYTGTSAPRVLRLLGDARNAMVAATSSVVGHAPWSASGKSQKAAQVSLAHLAEAVGVPVLTLFGLLDKWLTGHDVVD